jgi:hypothetical protein
MRLRLRAWPVSRLAWMAALLIVGFGALPLAGTGYAQAQPDDDGVAGVWSASVADSDVPTDLGSGPSLIGRWRIEFREDGSYAGIREDVGQVVGGTWAVEGDTLTITDESGPSSCAQPQPGVIDTVDAAVGTYRWTRGDDQLTLEATTDACEARRLLLTVRPLTVYVACTTESYPLDDPAPAPSQDELAATPAGATPAATPVLPEASPVDEGGVDESGEAPGGTVDTEAEIDALLAELSACWATGDPSRVLPLFSEVFLERLVLSGPPGTSIVDVAALFQELQRAPVIFERSCEVETDGPRRAQAEVTLRIGVEESTQQFDFVLEGGRWKLADLSVPPEPTTGD